MFAIRPFPVQKALSTIQMTINNQAMTIQIGDLLSALELFNIGREMKAIQWSKCATYPTSLCQNFLDLQGSARSPLSPASSVSDQNIPKSTSFIVTSSNAAVSGNATAVQYVDCVSTESIYLSPLFYGDYRENDSGFYGVKTMDFIFNFSNGCANRMMAIDGSLLYSTNGSTATTTADALARATTLNSQVTFGPFTGSTPGGAFSYTESTPSLLFQYITPQLVDRGNPMQQVLNYPYVGIERYPTDYGSTVSAVSAGLPVGGNFQINSTNVQLNSVPTKIYVFARLNNTQLLSNPYSPDSFLRLESMNLQWGGRSGLLSSASIQQLYDISVRAGCTQTFNDWAGRLQANANVNGLGLSTVGVQTGLVTQQYYGSGSVMAIDPIDLGLDSIEAPGKLEMITLQINANWSWLSTFAPSGNVITMYVVAVSAGVFTLFNGQASSLIGVLNSSDILNSHAQSEHKMLDYFETKQTYGGGFLSDLKHNLRHLKSKQSKATGGSGMATAGAASNGGARVHRATLAERLQ
jgi:hypothetical protein